MVDAFARLFRSRDAIFCRRWSSRAVMEVLPGLECSGTHNISVLALLRVVVDKRVGGCVRIIVIGFSQPLVNESVTLTRTECAPAGCRQSRCSPKQAFVPSGCRTLPP